MTEKGFLPLDNRASMTREELAAAADLLESAAGAATNPGTEEELTEIATQLDRLAEAERGPDHGRLARIEAKLHDLEPVEGGDAGTWSDEAFDEIHAYRETLDGV